MPTIFQHQQKEEGNGIIMRFSCRKEIWYIHKRVRWMKAKGRNIQRKEIRVRVKGQEK
jgi:hypothetical protein